MARQALRVGLRPWNFDELGAQVRIQITKIVVSQFIERKERSEQRQAGGSLNPAARLWPNRQAVRGPGRSTVSRNRAS
jgi:hypothetical protein